MEWVSSGKMWFCVKNHEIVIMKSKDLNTIQMAYKKKSLDKECQIEFVINNWPVPGLLILILRLM